MKEDEIINNTDIDEKEYEKKQAKIYNKVSEIKKVFSEINLEDEKIVTDLIKNIAFMSVELEYLKKHITKYGIKELYANGKDQYGYKETIESKVYNTMIKNYLGAIKQIKEYVPKNEQQEVDDLFDSFGSDI